MPMKKKASTEVSKNCSPQFTQWENQSKQQQHKKTEWFSIIMGIQYYRRQERFIEKKNRFEKIDHGKSFR